MSNNANLKPVDESFVDSFFGGILPEDSSIVSAPEIIEEPEQGLESEKEPAVKKSVLSADETFSLVELIEEEIEETTGEHPVTFKKSQPTSSEINTQINSLIEEGVLFGFDDDKFEVKTTEELKELLVANKEEWKRQVLEEEYEKDFAGLPYEMQYAVEYVKKGGTDMKALFKALSETQEVQTLDPEKNPKDVSRAYLEATNFGTEEEITEQVEEWDDLGLLEKKAKSFKPKLDKIAEQKIQEKLKEQDEINAQQQQLAQKYYSSIQETLKAKKINDIELDAKEQEAAYKVLTENIYTSTRTGAATNFLGKFLEDITWNKPNYELMVELALWAKDPNAFKEKLKKIGKEEGVAATEKLLRTNKPNIKSQELPESTPKTTIGRNTIGRMGSGLLKR